MAKKIKTHEIYMKTEINKVEVRQEEKYKEFEDRLFEYDQKIKACLNVKDELLNLEQQQRKLHEFVDQYNRKTIEQNTEIRQMLSDINKALQTQLNRHDDILDNFKPRILANEGQLTAHSDRMDKMTEMLEAHKKQLIDLQTNKVNNVDDEKNRKVIGKRMKQIEKSHDMLLNQ